MKTSTNTIKFPISQQGVFIPLESLKNLIAPDYKVSYHTSFIAIEEESTSPIELIEVEEKDLDADTKRELEEARKMDISEFIDY